MKNYVLLCLITLSLIGTICLCEAREEYSEPYRFELLSSYDDCIKILEDNNLIYTVHEIHDMHGSGITIVVEDYMNINNKKVLLVLSFPDTLKMVNKFVRFNSKVLLSFSYVIMDIDLDYAKSFVRYWSDYLGEPIINQFEGEYAKDCQVKFVGWENNSYNINCLAFLDKEERTRISIAFSITDEQRIITERKY